jgi:hypothetical protein
MARLASQSIRLNRRPQRGTEEEENEELFSLFSSAASCSKFLLWVN